MNKVTPPHSFTTLVKRWDQCLLQGPEVQLCYVKANYVQTQDSVPSNTKKHTFWKTDFVVFWPVNFWPSSNLNLLDYEVRDILEQVTKKTSHLKINAAKAVIKEWAKVSKDFVVKLTMVVLRL